MALSPLARSATARRRVKSATGFRLNRGKLHSGGASTVSKFRWYWGRTVRAASLRPGVSKYKFTVVTNIAMAVGAFVQVDFSRGVERDGGRLQGVLQLLGFLWDWPGPRREVNGGISDQDNHNGENDKEENFGERAIFLEWRFHLVRRNRALAK